MFIYIVLIIAIVSFLLAVKSLRGLNAKPDVEHLRKKLNKHKVIFQSHSDSSSKS